MSAYAHACARSVCACLFVCGYLCVCVCVMEAAHSRSTIMWFRKFDKN